MSKMDNLRAMREAKYDAMKRAGAGTAKPAKTATAAKTAAKSAPKSATPAKAAPASAEAESETEELCGHRNMSGRTCTRERGHSAKSHRYS